MPTPGQQSPFFWPGMDGKPPNFITREKTTKKRRPNCDETLPIINKPKSPQKKGAGENKMEGLTFKKTKKPLKTHYYKMWVQFISPHLLDE